MRSLIATLGVLVFTLVPFAPAAAFDRTYIAVQNQHTPPPQEPGLGIRLLDVPAHTQDDPRARSYIVDHLKPGAAIARRVQITNGTSSPQIVKLYPGAAFIKDDSFHVQDGAAENELTRWISIEQPQIKLVPGEVSEALVSITVPEDAHENEQYAVIWAEIRSAPSEGTKITTASRVGIRVYLSVGPGNGPPARFSIDNLQAGRTSEGAPEVTTIVTNTGGRALDISGSLKLTDGPGSMSAGPHPVSKGTTLAPGESAPILIELPPELPKGPWKADLELVSGLVKQRASATIIFPDVETATIAKSNELSFALIVSIISVIALSFLVTTIWWKRRKSKSALNIKKP